MDDPVGVEAVHHHVSSAPLGQAVGIVGDRLADVEPGAGKLAEAAPGDHQSPRRQVGTVSGGPTEPDGSAPMTWTVGDCSFR